MKPNRVILITVAFFLLVGALSAHAAPLATIPSKVPWIARLFKADEDGIYNLSTAFVGGLYKPVLSYSKAGSQYIHFAFAASESVPGSCGPDNTWYCAQWLQINLVPGTLSDIAAMSLAESHLIGWAYATDSSILGAQQEYLDDMTFVTKSTQKLIDLSKFGGLLVGAPSLQLVGGHYRLAVTIRSGGATPTYKLVYLYYIGNVDNDSCMTSGFAYQCDVIEEGTIPLGAPSMQMAPDGTVGIAYYKSGGGLDYGVTYAYPNVDSMQRPSNCGPGDPKTWRCISIYNGTETGEVGQVVKFAFGRSGDFRGIVFTYDDELIDDTLRYAEFVIAGGNCGWDGGVIAAYQWECTDVDILGDLAPSVVRSFSFDIDRYGYPVIAYEKAESDLSPINLYIAYPKHRYGIPEPGWMAQEIDGAPVDFVDTGAQAAISINYHDLGLIGYLQREDYELPDLKIARQYYQFFMPIIFR